MPDRETPATALDDRYGRARQRGIDRRLGWALAGAAVLAAIVFLLFGGWQTNSTVEAKVIDYEVIDARTVRVDFHVSAPAGTRVGCAVEALSQSFSTVGWKVIDLPPSDRLTRELSENIVTTYGAATGTVYGCWPVAASR